MPSYHWTIAPPVKKFTLPPVASYLERALQYESAVRVAERWTTIPLVDFELVTEDIIQECLRCIAGPNTVYDMSSHKRYVPTDHVIPSHADTAGQYLRRMLQAYGEVDLSFIPGREEAYEDLPVLPAYYDGKRHNREKLAMIDVNACYWSLLQNVPLDSYIDQGDVQHGRMTFLEPNLVQQSKEMRNSIYGLTRVPSTTKLYKMGKEISESNKPMPWWNPHLTHIIASTMQSIAVESIAKFPVYMWLTDAAIIPAKRASEYMEWLMTNWKLGSRIADQGTGVLNGMGSYAIGNTLTTVEYSSEVSNLNEDIDFTFWKMNRQWFANKPPHKLLPKLPVEASWLSMAFQNWDAPDLITIGA